MGSSIIHNDIKKVVGLLVGAVHMVKSPANRKKFFLMKGEQKMTDEALKVKLKEQKLSEDEIAFVLSNDTIKSILADDENKKAALEVVKDGIRKELVELENALESKSISDLTTKMVKPFESITNFLSPPTEEDDTEEDGDDNNKDKDKKEDDKNQDVVDGDEDTDVDNSDDEDVNSVLELAEEISGLVEEVEGLAEAITD